MFVTSLLKKKIGYKIMGIEKISKKMGGNKVHLKMRINSCVKYLL